MHRILSNPFYMGKMVWKGRLYDGKHKPLISAALFDRVQQRMRRKTTPKYTKHNPVFKGMMHCAEMRHDRMGNPARTLVWSL